MALSLREHQKEPHRLGHLLYWQQLLDPEGEADMVTQSDRSLFSTLAYRGADLESASAAEKMMRTQHLHQVLLSLGTGWGWHVDVRRRKADPYPARRWPHPVPALIDTECEEMVHEAHFETDYHLTVTQHLRGLGDEWQALLWENIPEESTTLAPSRAFREEVARMIADLGAVFAEVALLRGRDLCGYLKSTISMVEQDIDIPDPPWFLGSSLCDMAFDPGAVLMLGDFYVRVLTVKNRRRPRQAGYPPETVPDVLGLLHALPMEFRLNHRWQPLALAAADKELNQYENYYLQQGKAIGAALLEKFTGGASRKRNHAADDAAAEVAEARRLLQEGLLQFGYFNTTVLVWDTDYAAMEAKRKLVEDTLRTARFVILPETFNAPEAFLGTLPGDFYHNPRKPLVSSLTVAHCLGTDSVSAGAKWVPYLQGGPWVIGTATGQTPYGVTTHHGDVGDYFCIGPKGSGKSAWQALLDMQWLQYDTGKGRPQIRAFDKDGSLMCPTYAVEGVWMDLTPGKCEPLQPLAHIDTEEEQSEIAEWLGILLTLEHIVVTHEVRAEIGAVLRQLATFPIHRRTMSGLAGLVTPPALRNAIGLYTRGNTYGFLDGDRDPLPTNDWQCYEIGGLLKRPRIIPVVMPIVNRAIRRQLDGRPTLISYDEVWAGWRVESEAERMLDEVKTVRRLNGTLGYLTQELFDIHSSPISAAIINSCMTQFWLANPNALVPEPSKIYAGYGLSETQRAIIAQMVQKRDIYMTSQGHGHRRFQMRMGPVTQALCGRSRVQDLAAIQEVKATAREPFAVAWLRHEGLSDAANLLAETFDTKGRADAAVARVVTVPSESFVLS